MKPIEVKAILFDLHHTISKHSVSPNQILRKSAECVGIDMSGFSNTRLNEVFEKVDEWLREFQIRNSVGIHWGAQAEDWLEADKIFLEGLGYSDIEDEVVLEFERRWKAGMNNHHTEILHDEAKSTLEELHRRGYQIGICTRRTDDPEDLLERWGIRHLIATVHWSGVVGYAKPSPYTLLAAARDLGINPRLCMFVGNWVNADILAAMRAEMIPVLLTWANPEEGEKAPPEAITLGAPAEILRILP